MQNLGSSIASDGGTEPYYPLMPPISSSPPPSPTEIYHVPDATIPVPISVSVSGDPLATTAVTPVGLGPTSIEPAKRKRGRPRKYAPTDGPANYGILSPPPMSAAALGGEGKKARGRPPGSGRKQQFGELGSAGAGVGFRSHIITLRAGEDVLAKLTSVCRSTSQAVCILSANGSISNVTLQQATISGGTVTYQGHFQILSLSGFFHVPESGGGGGERSRTGRLSVVLAGPDGHVIGGPVAGILTAASIVTIVVGSFSMEGQKKLKLDHSDPPPSTLVSGAAKSSSSLGTVSESSGEPVSPHNNQLVETSNNSPPVANNNLSWGEHL